MPSDMRTFCEGDQYLKVDHHMHSKYSDGKSTIEEYINEAKKLGIKEIAITDHVWRSSDWVDEYIKEIEELREKNDLKLLAGLEAKVVDEDGSVDVSKEDSEKVDFIMGVVHRYRPEASEPVDDSLNLDPEEAAATERNLTIKMLDNPNVDLIGHPSRTYYKFHYGKETPEFPDKYFKDMISKANEVGKPLEYNARLPSRVRQKLLQLYLDSNLSFTLGSDSHECGKLQNMDHEFLRKKIEEVKGAKERIEDL